DQLSSHEQRLGAAGREEHERRPEVEKADPLVVGRHHPAEDAGARLPHALEPLEHLLGWGGRRRDGRGYLSPSRYATRACSCLPLSWKSGISFPGLKCWESAIQRARSPGVSGIVTPPSVVRLARWVRSGPTNPRAGVPRIVWQLEHAPLRKTCSPRRASEVAGAAA